MRLDLLEKLADHLEHGQLGHKVFNFSVLNAGPLPDGPPPYSCGYIGCALGECPNLWPEEWWFDKNGVPQLRGVFTHFQNSAMQFFELDAEEAEHLFYSEEQNPKWGNILGDDATKEEVAENIRLFIKIFI